MKKVLLAFAATMTLLSVLAWAGASQVDIHRLAGELVVHVDHRPVQVGSGKPASVERTLPAFERIALRSAENVEVRVGGKHSVKVSGDDNLLELVETRVEGDTLVIESRGSYRTKTPLLVEVQLPRLRHFALDGSADARLSGIRGERLGVELNGSGDIEASGEVDELEVEVNGSGDADLGSLWAKHVEAELNGSGDIDVAASEELRAEINGSGDIRYRGAPAKLRSEVNGSGDVEAVR